MGTGPLDGTGLRANPISPASPSALRGSARADRPAPSHAGVGTPLTQQMGRVRHRSNGSAERPVHGDRRRPRASADDPRLTRARRRSASGSGVLPGPAPRAGCDRAGTRRCCRARRCARAHRWASASTREAQRSLDSDSSRQSARAGNRCQRSASWAWHLAGHELLARRGRSEAGSVARQPSFLQASWQCPTPSAGASAGSPLTCRAGCDGSWAGTGPLPRGITFSRRRRSDCFAAGSGLVGGSAASMPKTSRRPRSPGTDGDDRDLYLRASGPLRPADRRAGAARRRAGADERRVTAPAPRRGVTRVHSTGTADERRSRRWAVRGERAENALHGSVLSAATATRPIGFAGPEDVPPGAFQPPPPPSESPAPHEQRHRQLSTPTRLASGRHAAHLRYPRHIAARRPQPRRGVADQQRTPTVPVKLLAGSSKTPTSVGLLQGSRNRGPRSSTLVSLRWTPMDAASLIDIQADVRSGKPCFVGTRITVCDVLEYLASGHVRPGDRRRFPRAH